jgi:hypothetical protein
MEMCREEGVSLQRGMNFCLRGPVSVILMSRRLGAPYTDKIEDRGKLLIYQGHDAPHTRGCPEPKKVDQPEFSPTGALTKNGLFWKAVRTFKEGRALASRVKVYDEIKTGIWTYAGIFELIDAWLEYESGRRTFKFKLRILDDLRDIATEGHHNIPHNRLIPTDVKIEAWKSLIAGNIQLLCAKHNLQKRNNIE